MDNYWRVYCGKRVKAWMKRRQEKGIEPTADDIWEYIKERWPKSENHEEIFQEAGK